MEQTKAILESEDPSQIQTLTREDLLGDMFHAGSLGYYGQYLSLSHIAGLQQQGHHYLSAGYGTIGYEPNVSYFFGVPRAIEPGGVSFDIPLIFVSEVGDGDADKKKSFVVQTGVLSSTLEHVVPEQMFSNLDGSASNTDAISAVKALQKANLQGQKIYRINEENMGSLLGSIHHDTATILEIRSALLAGKEVITHTNSVSVPGWSGAGYIILDPDTGMGAYKIAGGSNGSYDKVDELNDFAYIMSLMMTDANFVVQLFENNPAVRNATIKVFDFMGKMFSFLGYATDIIKTVRDCVLNNNDPGNTNDEAMAAITIIVTAVLLITTILLQGVKFANPLFGMIVNAFFDVIADQLISRFRSLACD